MQIVVDTHTHSVASGHAYSTVDELAAGAAANGLLGFVLTDHGPAMPGGPHPWHFGNLRVLPASIRGVRFFRGVEANIMDREGGLDLVEREMARLEFVMAGFHDVCFEPGPQARNTEAMVAALANPWVDAICHPGNPVFPVDVAAVVAAAKEYGKALEVNNSSFTIRRGSEDGCLRFALECASRGARIVVGSDAHFHTQVGVLDRALDLLDAAGVPEELVVNADLARFEEFLAERAEARRDLVAAVLAR